MKGMKYLYFGFIIVCISSVHGQENNLFKLKTILNKYPYLLKIITEGKLNSHKLKAAGWQQKVTLANQSATERNWYPSLWFESEIAREKKYNIKNDNNFTTYNNHIKLYQPLWDSEIFYSNKVAKTKVDQSHWEFIDTEQQLILSILTTYFIYLTEQENKTTYQSIINNTKKRYEIVKAEFELGKKLKVDLLEVKSELINKEYELTKSENDSRKSLAHLSVLINRNLKPTEIKTRKIELLTISNPTKINTLAKQKNAKLKRTEEEEIEFNHRLDQLEHEYTPKVYLGASYGFKSEDEFEFSNHEEETEIMIGLSWEFFDFTRSDRKLGALNQLKSSVEQKKLIELEIERDIATLFLELRNLNSEITSQKERIIQLMELYQLRKELYSAGRISLTDLSITENVLLKTQLKLTKTKAKQNIAVVNLWVLAGGDQL